MRSRDLRRGRLLSVESVAGWVFADLLLVLFLVGLGSAAPSEPEPTPQPKPKIAKPRPPIVGMKTDPVTAIVQFDAEAVATSSTSRAVQRELCKKVSAATRSVSGQRAALVLIFGGAPDVVRGQESARAVARQLPCASPKVFEKRTPTRAFWDGGLPLGTARIEVFLFTTKAVDKTAHDTR